MKRLPFILVVLFLQFTSSFAQKGPGPSPKDRIADLKCKLDLTDTQTKKIENIFEENHKKMDALFEKNKEDRKTSHKAMKELMDSTDKEIEKVLTKDQMEKYKKMIDERKNDKGKRMPPPDGPGNGDNRMPPPPPDESED